MQPWRFADLLWLAAHDSGDGRSIVGERPLGVGLGAALFAELIDDGFLTLRDGELVRTTRESPSDHVALEPLLAKMAEEEKEQAEGELGLEKQNSQASVRTTVRVHAVARVATWDTSGQSLPLPGAVGRDLPNPAGASRDWPPLPAHVYAPAMTEAGQHRQLPGHPLGKWMSYLKYGRAEDLVTARLARGGLARREERRGLFGTKVWYVPWDSNISGSPAISIITALRRREVLSESQLVLAGLFLATGISQHALATLSADEQSWLERQLTVALAEPVRQLLRAVEISLGNAAMR
ncbi:GPP34 family phosphoprotein [Paractinoplanes globisporus]|uniref:GPP34 family phosphoprotein n=1 Tax=Paractinoplanes globisporus TaxID=113565 RepID=A0ABW6WJ32_9ACTN|nr:GPP34 family phosphoprotein [Actinoplanes globisporus]